MLDHWPQNHKVKALTQFPQLVSKFLLCARYTLLLQMMRNQKNQFSLEKPSPLLWACLLINSSVVKRALSLWSTFPQKNLKERAGLGTFQNTGGLSGGLVRTDNLYQWLSKCDPRTNHNQHRFGNMLDIQNLRPPFQIY